MVAEDRGKMCEKRSDGWYCVSFDDYLRDRFDNAIKAKEYADEQVGYKFGINRQEQ